MFMDVFSFTGVGEPPAGRYIHFGFCARTNFQNHFLNGYSWAYYLAVSSMGRPARVAQCTVLRANGFAK
jgi:hypothetical protein